VIVLGDTTARFEANLGVTPTSELRVLVRYWDITTVEYGASGQSTITEGVTPVTCCGSPIGLRARRAIEHVQAFNWNVSSVVLTFNTVLNEVETLAWSDTLLTGESVTYESGTGWRHFDADGVDITVIGSPGIAGGDKGDIVVTAGGGTWTVDNDVVTNAKAANMAANSIKGNNTGGVADPLDLTAAQVKTLLAIANTDVSGLGTLSTQSGTFSGTSSGTNTGDQVIEPPSGDLFKVLTAGEVGQNVNTAQPWFPTAGAVTVDASTTYLFEGLLHLVRTAGVTSHTTSLLFGGTATLTSLRYEAFVKSGNSAASGTCNASMIAVATAFVVKSASVSASENVCIYVRGTIRINAGGTLIPQFIYSAAPGGAPTVQANSFFYLNKLGSDVVASQGTWA